MDPRLLQHYNLELQHLREMGAEFAAEFPKIAGRLGMNNLEVADPYVERLLEGVSFLAARVQLKLDAEFPRFTQALLDIIYPHYLAPTPSMLVAQLKPDASDPNLATGVTVARHSTMRSTATGDGDTTCEFRTAHPVTLWPVEVSSVSYFSFAPDLPLNALPVGQSIKGGLRLRLKTTAGLKFSNTAIDHLCVYLTGHEETANQLYELCLASGLGVMVLPGKGAIRRHEWLPASSIRPVGFADAEALLPVTLRSFQGYRLLHEYFSFPQRYRFVDLAGLAGAMTRADSDEIELVIPFGKGEPTLERVVDASNVALFCTPAVNVFEKRADRIQVTDGSFEYHVVPDRTRPLDFEVYGVTEVEGHGSGSEGAQVFLPLYTAYSSDRAGQRSAYFTTRREPRLISAGEQRRGSRSSYIGTEVFLGLVDAAHAPFSGDLRQLSVRTWCTNRDLVLHMPRGLGKSDLFLDMAAPVTSIRVVSGPSRPYAALADGSVSWRAISHLSLNYLSLVNSTPHDGATALREILGLYAPSTNATAQKHIDGIRSVSVDRVVRRLPQATRSTTANRPAPHEPLAFGRGLQISLEVDDLAFEGASAYLLGSVLDQYFSRYASINAVTETVLRSPSRGEITRWAPHWGARPTL